MKSSQRKRFLQILNFNSDPTKESHLTWKVLIYDNRGLSIISSILNFSSNLSDFGVTFHSNIAEKRDRIGDVPAVFFIEPTDKNLDILLNDLSSNIYDTFYINFISSISQDKLREFARKASEKCDGRSIGGISDAFLDFTCQDDRRFELFDKATTLFSDLYGRTKQEADLKRTCDVITDKLLSVIQTNMLINSPTNPINKVPLILSRGEISDLCSDLLSEKLTKLINNIKAKNKSSDLMNQNKRKKGSESSSQIENNDNNERPVLVLIDRCVDFLIMAHHGTTYEALYYDLVDNKSQNNNQRSKNIDQNIINSSLNAIEWDEFKIDKDDKFWIENRNKPFGTVLTSLSSLFRTFQKDFNGIDGNVTSALSNLDGLKALQKSVSSHTNICERLLKLVDKRNIKNLFSKEVDIISTPTFNFLNDDLLNQELNSCELEDKLRVLTVAVMADVLSSSDFEELRNTYKNFLDFSKVDLGFLKNVEFFKTFSKSKNSGFFDSLRGRFNVNLKDDDGGNSILARMPVAETVRKVLSGNDEGLKVVDLLLENKNDSNSNSNNNVGGQHFRHQQRKNVIAFVVGGGSFSEFAGIEMLNQEKRAEGVEVTYGCTAMQRPSDFMNELMEL